MHTRAGRRFVGQAGMTMLEIMIVLAILALVMGLLVGPKVWNMFRRGKADTARLQVKQLTYEGYPMWARSAGDPCPDKLDRLLPFVNGESTKDVWKRELVMLCGDDTSHGKPANVPFAIVSKGADGKLGTKDDIKSWEIK